MWYLVLYLTGTYSAAITVIPEKYATEQACYEASRYWVDKAKCVRAPEQSSASQGSVLCQDDKTVKLRGMIFYCE